MLPVFLDDSHNIIVVGDNDRDMAIAVKEMMRTQGGYTLGMQWRDFMEPYHFLSRD